jgi:hypothetical protein
MHPSNTVTRAAVTADVRIAGTDREFERRDFDLMVGSNQDLTKQRLEAKRILHQLGYDVRGINLSAYRSV